MQLPSPISWPPSEYLDGDDGSWSSFPLRVGNPPQLVRTLISTAGQATWVVIPRGCKPGPQTSPTCTQSRAGIFDSNSSTTWNRKGNYALGLETNLGSNETATYGFDTLDLGFSNTTGVVSLDSQVIAGFSSNHYYTALFGLGRQPTNFTALDDSKPSFLTTLKTQNLIPSLSWSYTAGAPYRLKGFLGSLTFGGYDASRFTPNNVSFTLANDVSRDLVVGLQSILAKNSTGQSILLLPSSILTYIDSTVPYIYLPLEACRLFEQTLGLIWDASLRLYTLDEGLHQSLLANNTNFTFRISDSTGVDSTSKDSTVDVVLPYASFDLVANFPFVKNTTRYFPIRRAANESQYTLGRTFLQEAYIITDHERSNFSVSQCKFDNHLPKSIIDIPSLVTPPPAAVPTILPGRNSNLALKIGVSVGVVSLLLGCLMIALVRRKTLSTRLKQDSGHRNTPLPRPSILELGMDGPLPEVEHNSLHRFKEVADTGIVELQAEKSRQTSRAAVRKVYDPRSQRASNNRSNQQPQQEQVMASELLAPEDMPTRSRNAQKFSPSRRLALCISAAYSARSTVSQGQRQIDPNSSNQHVVSPCTPDQSPDLGKPLPPTPGSRRTSLMSDSSGSSLEKLQELEPRTGIALPPWWRGTKDTTRINSGFNWNSLRAQNYF